MSYLDIDLDLSDRERELRAAAHQFAREVLRPAATALDEQRAGEVVARGSLLWEVLRKAYRLGYHTVGIPEAVGGQGFTPRERHIVSEELGWGCSGLAIAIGVASFPFQAAALSGDPGLVDAYVRPFVQDTEARLVGCWAGTEPNHGSDFITIGSPDHHNPAIVPDVRACLDGDDWVIRGQKSSWVSLGTIATHALAFLSVDPAHGMSGNGVAVIPLEQPGVSKGPALNKLGQRPLNQGEIFFDDVRIPRNHMLVGPEGYEIYVDAILAGANALMGATFTGVARAAFEEALAYSKTRVQGGKPLCEHQLVQKDLFQMFTKVEAARRLSRAAFVYNSQTLPPATEYSIAAKVFCTQAAFDVSSTALQIHGGYGLSKEYVVEKLFRDARASLIEDGTNDVLGLAAARMLVARYGMA
jgi:alkylation response protein AidB-like acyl-CoA dehydrogenase